MATKINVMIFLDRIVTSYVTTICFTEKYIDIKNKEEVLNKAKLAAFNYGITFGTITIKVYEFREIYSDEQIFKFLENNGTIR